MFSINIVNQIQPGTRPLTLGISMETGKTVALREISSLNGNFLDRNYRISILSGSFSIRIFSENYLHKKIFFHFFVLFGSDFILSSPRISTWFFAGFRQKLILQTGYDFNEFDWLKIRAFLVFQIYEIKAPKNVL